MRWFALQTQNSKFKFWRSEAEHATSQPRMLPIEEQLFIQPWRNIYKMNETNYFVQGGLGVYGGPSRFTIFIGTI